MRCTFIRHSPRRFRVRRRCWVRRWMTWDVDSVDEPQRSKLLFELLRRSKVDGLKSYRRGCVDIRLGIIDEEAFLRAKLELAQREFENLMFRLHDADFARHHDVVKQIEESVALAREAKFFRRPVRQAHEPMAVRMEALEDSNRFLDRTGDRLLPELVVGADQLPPMRKARRELGDGIVPRSSAAILLRVPSMKADFAE